MSPSLRWVACTALLRGPRAPAFASTCVGVTPYASLHASFSAICSDRCMCSGASCASAQPTTGFIWSRGTALTEWIAAPSRAPEWSSSMASTRSAHCSASPSLKRTCTPSGASPMPAAR